MYFLYNCTCGKLFIIIKPTFIHMNKEKGRVIMTKENAKVVRSIAHMLSLAGSAVNNKKLYL